LQTTEADVQEFLRDFKHELACSDWLHIAWRPARNQVLIELGFTMRNVIDEILSLTVADYSEGPLRDHNHPQTGDLWVFGKEIEGREIYIKLKLARRSALVIARCISFHDAEQPMEYPFR
jgi:hypothetical protein